MSWYRRRQYEQVDLSEFSEDGDYTGSQLEAYATAMLKQDRRENKHLDLGILFDEQLYNKSKREIIVDAFEIDGTLTNSIQDTDRPGVVKGDGQRIYNRAHPNGRKVNTEEARKTKGASYYKN